MTNPPHRRISPCCAAGRDLTELEIRTALIQSLAYGAIVLEEFPAAGGRLDLLTISGETLVGFEIKSDFDSLQRVKTQVAIFSQYCDTLTFVAGRRFALPLLSSLPIWCGISLAYRSTSRQIMIIPLRHARMNPLVSATASISLLRRDELLAINPQKGQARMRRRALQDQLLTARSFGELRACLSAALMLRERSRFDELRRLDGDLCPPEATSLDFPSGEFDVI